MIGGGQLREASEWYRSRVSQALVKHALSPSKYPPGLLKHSKSLRGRQADEEERLKVDGRPLL